MTGLVSGVKSSRRLYYVLALLILIEVKIILVRDQPLLANTLARLDDAHFIDQAMYMLGRSWLGPYDQYTLVKGPFLSIWIVITFLLGIPFLLSLQLLYALACVVTVTAIGPVLRRRVYSLLVFAALLYNPMTYDTAVVTRVTRDALYTCLCLLTVACAAGLYLRRNEPDIRKLPWALGLGVAFSASALTREETVWLVPSMLLAFACYWIGLSASVFKDRLVQVKVWAALPLTYFVFTGAVSALNYWHYSLFSVTEMAAPPFVAAYSALQRVVPDTFEPAVPVTKDTRMRIYRESPSFRLLRPYLEGPGSAGWASFRQRELPPIPRDEIAGGWFVWAFRDAVAAAGMYSSGRFPAEYYLTLAREVNTACDTGKLQCVDKPASLAPVFHEAYVKPAVEDFFYGFDLLVRFGSSEFTAHPANSISFGPEELLFQDLTRTEISKADTTRRVLAGWAVNEDQKVLEVVSSNGVEYPSDTTIEENLPSPDVYDHFLTLGKAIPSAESARFVITTSCAIECALDIRSGDTILARLAFSDLASGFGWSDSRTFVTIDSAATYTTGLIYQETYNLMKILLLERIGRFYQLIVPLCTIIAVLAYLTLTFQIRTRPEEWVVVTFFGAACLARLGFLSIISASSFYAMYTSYMAPCFPLFISFEVLAVLLVSRNIGEYRLLASRIFPSIFASRRLQ